MTSFELEVDEKSLVGSQFIHDVAKEMQRAIVTEKKSRKITQQSIADKLGTSRAVINRQVHGIENIGLRRVAEILWAIGWEAHFEARKIPDGNNQFKAPSLNISQTQGTVSISGIRTRVSTSSRLEGV